MNIVERIAPRTALFFLLRFADAVFIFPIREPSSSVFYISSFFLIASLAFASGRKGMQHALDYLWLNPEKKGIPVLFAWGVAVFLLMCATTFAANILFYFAGINDAVLVKQKISTLPLSVLVLASTFSPLAEEAFFRGLLFRKISGMPAGSASKNKRQHPGWVAGAIVSSAAFGAMHILYGSVAEVLAVFALGLVLCAATYRAKSLVPVVVAHALFNIASIAMMVLA